MSKKVEIGSPIYKEACRLFRIVNGSGTAGSEFEFQCINSGLRDGWLKLARKTLKVSGQVLGHGKVIASIKATNPPLKSLGAILQEVNHGGDSDIFYDDTYNENYALKIHLRVRELRRIKEFVDNLNVIYSKNPKANQ